MPGPRRLYAVLLGSALVAAPAVVAATPASAEVRTVAIVGDLQSELGCPDDWQPECPDTELDRVGDTSVYRGTFEVPGGDFQFKVALNDSWTENYGAGGKRDGENIPLLLAGPATITFTYDDVSHVVSFSPVVDEDTTPADAGLADDSLRSALTRERFYFVMADRSRTDRPATTRAASRVGPSRRASTPPTRASTTGVTSQASPRSSTTSRAWAPPPSG